MDVSFPNESREYRQARNDLLQKEIELRRQMEAVAEARRKLPPGGLVSEDYVFDGLGPDGRAAKVRLSELFAPGRDTLIVYNMMFPRWPADARPKPATGAFSALPREDSPCPSCAGLVDQFEGAARHLEAAGFNFVIIAKTTLDRLTAFAHERGWTHLRLLSSAHNGFNRDYNCEDEQGRQTPLLSVFQRTPDGIRHFWSSELSFAETEPGQDPRAAGTVEPLWNLMDLTPGGRPEWSEDFDDHGPRDARPALLVA